jgi:hypothetical protein
MHKYGKYCTWPNKLDLKKLPSYFDYLRGNTLTQKQKIQIEFPAKQKNLLNKLL